MITEHRARKVCFTAQRGFASTRIRAFQVAGALNADSFIYSFEKVKDYDVIVYVKYPVDAGEMRELRRMGKIQIVDPLDFYDFGALKKICGTIDGLIAASVTHHIRLTKRFSLPCRCIPHHHSNFKEQRIEIRPGPGLKLGFVGDRKYRRQNMFVKKITENIVFDSLFEDLDKTYLSIDLGIAFRNVKDKTLYNSNVKLLNFMSYGIPSVVSPELSYFEIANHGEHCLFARSRADFMDTVRYLMNDFELRKRMSDKAFERARENHIGKIAQRYRNYFSDVFNIKV